MFNLKEMVMANVSGFNNALSAMAKMSSVTEGRVIVAFPASRGHYTLKCVKATPLPFGTYMFEEICVLKNVPQEDMKRTICRALERTRSDPVFLVGKNDSILRSKLTRVGWNLRRRRNEKLIEVAFNAT
ncbi:MAG: hypothetical protein Q7S08_02500 [bacterium]|nr:hypothetical protein [bacterium]